MREQHARRESVLEAEMPALSSVQVKVTATQGDPYGVEASGCDANKAVFDQVERILQSDELRGCEGLRRLLRFLATKSLGPGGEDLKEYIVAIDGLGKSSSYDPRRNSAARIQVARLRQKLTDYYLREGVDDPVIIGIPKGRFKLTHELRGPRTAAAHEAALPMTVKSHAMSERRGWKQNFAKLRIPATITAGVLMALVVGAIYNALKPAAAKATGVEYTPAWNADMDELWQPFVATSRPTIVAIEDPLFVELDGKKGVYYRDKSLNTWQDVTSSSAIGDVRAALHNRQMKPSRYYTAFGEVDASFLLAKLLGSRVQNLAVLKTSDLSMRDLADNNVVFVGLQNIFFASQIQAAPIETQLEPVHDGIQNVHPAPHEPALFVDQYTTAPTEQGIAYALVTHVPGPLGDSDVESFTSSRSAGYVAAVKAFSDPAFVKFLVPELRQIGHGRMPRYYQVLLKVKFTAEEPTEITFVLARELRYQGKS